MKSKEVKKIFSEFKNIPVDREFLHELRGKLEIQTAFDVREAGKLPGFSFKRIASAVTLASLLLGSTGTVFASQASLPGETLYPVKKLVENVRLAAAIDQKTKADIRLGIAEERLTEINALLAEKQVQNSSSSSALENNIEEAAKDFDSQLKEISRNAEELERAGKIEKALRINTDLYFFGKNYKKLIEKNKEDSSKPIKVRLEGSSRENDRATENAKERMEHLKKDNDKKSDSEDGEGTSSTSVQISGQATISNSYNIRDEKKAPDPFIWVPPKNDSQGKVDSNPENRISENEEENPENRREPEKQPRETNSFQIKINL
ncbi:MAG: hypothetical protein LiPW15_221 [Parcubacteria group bacterium LiPW_15]|nr:MAG: hypothetical protein LiPW15_221 [Parcubacteria group bacterium LiPW_15]